MTKKLRFGNTYNSGRVTFLVIPEKDKYLGICLEFDLVIQADSFKEAEEEIEDYAKLWHKNIVKNRLSEELLNKPAPRKYWRIHEKLLEQDLKKIKADKKIPNIQGSKLGGAAKCQYPYSNFNFAT